MSFFARVWLAWVAYFRVLFDGGFASRVKDLAEGRTAPTLPAKTAEKSAEKEPAQKNEKTEKPAKKKDDTNAALALLALFQREGRLVDFLEQDVTTFSDADVGAAARVVHEGCRKALRAHATISPVRAEDEDAKVTIAEGYAPSEVKLTGNVKGSPPFTGTLKHRGWKVETFKLPVTTQDHDAHVLAPAEVEL